MGTTIRQISKFVKKLAQIASLSEDEESLSRDCIVGISKTGSCKVSEIVRVTKGGDAPLREDTQPFYEGLASKTSLLDSLREAWLAFVARVANRMPFIAVDLSDISKPHGKTFDFLAQVRNASDPSKSIGPGFNTIQIEATNHEHINLPLVQQTFSTDCPEYRSWYDIIGRAMLMVLQYIGKNATWLFDRGFDALDFYLFLNTLGIRWVVRQLQTRNVVLENGVTMLMSDLAQSLVKPFKTQVSYVDKKTHELRLWPVSFNFVPVRLPDLPGRFWMIVITGMRDEDMVLLTNCKVLRKTDAEKIIHAFLRRWAVEEGIRCYKQVTQVEDFRVRNWNSIRRITFFAMLAYGIQSLWLLTRPAMAARLIKRVKQFIETVPFKHYRMWAGVQDALNSRA